MPNSLAAKDCSLLFWVSFPCNRNSSTQENDFRGYGFCRLIRDGSRLDKDLFSPQFEEEQIY